MIRNFKTKKSRKTKTSQNNSSDLQYIDYNITTTIDSAGTVFKVTMPVYGTNASSRVGDKIRMLKLDLNLFFLSSAETQFRFTVIQGIGYIPALATTGVFSPGVSTTVDITSHFRAGAIGRYFKVLVDDAFVMIPSSSNAQKAKKLRLDIPIKEGNFEPGGNDLFSGQLYIIAISDSTLAPHPGLECAARLWYMG